jgi:hypothetical protein
MCLGFQWLLQPEVLQEFMSNAIDRSYFILLDFGSAGLKGRLI